jgi:hypothetical protein
MAKIYNPLLDMQANAVELKGEKAQSSTQHPKLMTTKASLYWLSYRKTINQIVEFKVVKDVIIVTTYFSLWSQILTNQSVPQLIKAW